jgi:hypothetical protein
MGGHEKLLLYFKVGAIQFVEAQLGRPLQHIVCLYHFIELPVRHLFEELDGGNNFGPIGNCMTSVVEHQFSKNES